MGAMIPPPPTCRWRGAAGTYLQSDHAFVEECLRWGPCRPPLPSLRRWQESAAAYLEVGRAFVEECGRMGAMSRQSLSQVDRARAEFDAADILYTQALDDLEV